jgi:hypothetical protein
MARRPRPELPVSVKRLRARIEHWRRTRLRRTTMPPALWAEAVALAGLHGAYPVARGARVSFEGLKRRIAEAGATGRATTAARSSTFVELTGAQLLSGGAAPEVGTVVELSDGSGTRLAIRLAREAVLDVTAMVAAFRQRRA